MSRDNAFSFRCDPHIIQAYAQMGQKKKKRILKYLRRQFARAVEFNQTTSLPDFTDLEEEYVNERDNGLLELLLREDELHQQMIDFIKTNMHNNNSEDVGYVYLLATPQQLEESVYKIGVSKDVDERIKQLNVGTHEHFEKVAVFKTCDPYTVESELHQEYEDKRLEGEFFRLTDNDLIRIFNRYDDLMMMCHESKFLLLKRRID